MDFYDYINRYELAFKKKLYAAYKERQAYEKDIKNINTEIRRMKSIFKKPISIAITGGLVGGNMFAMLFAIMFQSQLWIAYLIGLLGSLSLGLANEAYERKWKAEMDSLYTALKEVHKSKHDKEVIESRLKSLIDDVHTCYQYYFYMVSEEDKKKPITIDPKEVYESHCKLSTFLHEFYNGDLANFENLQPYQQIRHEHSLYLNSKIRNAKEEKLGFREPIERPKRRMANRYYNQYVVSGSSAIKR